MKLAALLVTLLLAVPAPAEELTGLWKAKRRFGPDARGALTVEKTPSGWTADFLGRILPVRAEGSELSFELDDGEGSFQGRMQDGAIKGHWTPPNSVVHGFQYASPVLLEPDGPNRWRGNVEPRHDTFTLFLMLQKRPDGTVGAFLRNPERNIGIFYDVDRLVLDGRKVDLIGKRRGAKEESAFLSGVYDPEREVLSIFFPSRGGTYDFYRDGEHSDFYPRGKNPARYVYRPPLARDDGWPTGTLDEANIDRAGIEKFIQMLIDRPIESVRTPIVEGILIARHGKLVLEEYFHGEHRDKLHESRSAAKSLAATLVGAAIEAGAPLALSSPVYKVMNGGAFPADLDPQKRAMTLEHLLMMRSGFFCDDSNDAAPGNENFMIDEAEEPDTYRFTLAVPMATAPGEKPVYCSSQPNLALGVLHRATGEPVLETFDRLVARPMKMRHYGWWLDRAGNPYGGGGVQLYPRDFMKLGQLTVWSAAAPAAAF